MIPLTILMTLLASAVVIAVAYVAVQDPRAETTASASGVRMSVLPTRPPTGGADKSHGSA